MNKNEKKNKTHHVKKLAGFRVLLACPVNVDCECQVAIIHRMEQPRYLIPWPLSARHCENRHHLLEHVRDGQEGCLAGQATRLAIGIRGQISQQGRVVVDPGISLGVEPVAIPRRVLGWQSSTGTIENSLWELVTAPYLREYVVGLRHVFNSLV